MAGWSGWHLRRGKSGRTPSRPPSRPVRTRVGGLLPIRRPQRVPQQSDHCRRSEPGTASGTGWAHGAVVAFGSRGPPKSANHRTNETAAYSRLRAKPQPLWCLRATCVNGILGGGLLLAIRIGGTNRPCHRRVRGAEFRFTIALDPLSF